MSLPLDTLEDVERWDIACADFQTALETRFPSFPLEHHVEHFLTDSDIVLGTAMFITCLVKGERPRWRSGKD